MFARVSSAQSRMSAGITGIVTGRRQRTVPCLLVRCEEMLSNKMLSNKTLSIDEKAKRIIEDIQQEKGCSPVRIFKNMAQKEYISIHGPEHHILDGACILTAFYNAGGNIRLEESLTKIAHEGLRMPGAMCGLWGICGAIASVGAALSIIDGTGPLSDDGTWGEHMKFTSQAISELGRINGPRCCKRDAMIAFREGIRYINEHYGVVLEYEDQRCEFSERNQQCLRERCPFFGAEG